MAPFLHTHPYEPFLFKEATKLIVGTLPPPRFTIGDLKEGDVDFCYGSRDGQLWPILDEIFKLNLKFETTEEAAQQRIDFLRQRKIGICDIVASAERTKIDASDVGMENIQLRNLLGYLREYPNVNTLLFTGGNSKNGPEYFFRRHLKENGLRLRLLSNEVPRIHEFDLPITNALDIAISRGRQPLVSAKTEISTRQIKTVSLIAPSGAANRAVGSLQAYKEMKKQHPELNTIDFRVLQYKAFF
ncbi:uracil-DNA glycosylase family protein [Arenibacter sp. 6A1]|uniref:uracil-DNA glycosylase family protein n=1 Tax=Arenibacter sp. 6A1 TaxID=2720391 RepID=UPI0014485DE1|nr:uracil-DNA glycosylase family protein [Arenibacter sp. 6A1]NKI28075.1 uracil-DNA glycosylase family protein [Arenibacter sp. 6A1]